MNRRKFIIGLLAAPVAAIASRFTSKALGKAGVIPSGHAKKIADAMNAMAAYYKQGTAPNISPDDPFGPLTPINPILLANMDKRAALMEIQGFRRRRQ